MSIPRRSPCLALLLSLAGCTGGGASFTTRLAPDFAPAHHTVSVFGVYKDGRMALGTWDTAFAYLKPALGPAQCPVLYDTLATTDQDLANALDELARDEGPTGNLLAAVAPAASGDLILVLSLTGKVPEHREEDPGPPTGAPVQNGMAQKRRRHEQAGGREPNQLDVSASLYSVTQARPVALVSMQYRGQSVGDALTRFARELAAAAPDLKCSGWNPAVKLDPAKVRPPLEVPAETHAE